MESRQMLYPYTLTGKIALFPYKFYFNNSWAYKYTIIGMIVCLPFFYKMQKLSYSPVNVARYEATMRKNREEIEEHKRHLL